MSEYESYNDFKEQLRVEQMTPLQMVREFHLTMGAKLDTSFNHADNDFRLNLLNEEVDEANDFESQENLLKELADIVYVCYGHAATFGWDLDKALVAIHRNNMGRCIQPDGSIKRREDGKIVKNPDYPKVNLQPYL